MNDRGGLHVIIPAGGAGTRLWPLSRSNRPKFLLDLTGTGRSLLQQTWDRLAPLAASMTVVTGRQHARAVADQLPEQLPEHVLIEPSPRDSMPAIGLATALVCRREPQAVVGSFAADHVIDDDEALAAAVASAMSAADAGYVCTIGIRPDRPSTAFGYVQTGDRLPSGALHATRFTEKPDLRTAQSYLADQRYVWNAGMFVSRADVLLAHLERQLPRLHAGLMAIVDSWDTPDRDATLSAVWPTLTRIPIDHAIAEPVAAAGGLACVPGRFGWDDVGDFAALSRLLPGDDVKVLGPDDLVRTVDATGVVVVADRRTVTVLGLDDAVVVDTADAVLVTTRAHAQRVKEARDAWSGERDGLL